MLTSVMRDHRISLFKAREAEVVAEMEEKDSRLEELEVSSPDVRVPRKLTSRRNWAKQTLLPDINLLQTVKHE
jgi:hypothetical protein